MNKHDNDKPDIDGFSGIETTGHEWDGIKELNNPAPRWWLWVLYLTIIWAIGYWVIYPAWPTLSGDGVRGGTKGTAGWTQYEQLKESQQEIIARKADYLSKFENSDVEEILKDKELYSFAIAGGHTIFKDNCATCHGSGGAGAKGYPNLNDDDWLWGGKIGDIYTSIRYGIRGNHDETHLSQMPAFTDVLSNDEMASLADYIIALSDGKGGENALYGEHCAACHGENAKGDSSIGAPNLADAIWLYSDGKDKNSIIAQMRAPKHGVMPAWVDRLSDTSIKQLAVYVYSLGGGQ